MDITEIAIVTYVKPNICIPFLISYPCYYYTMVILVNHVP